MLIPFVLYLAAPAAHPRQAAPPWIQEAITLGTAGEVRPVPVGSLYGKLNPLRVIDALEHGRDPALAYLTTPFIRVAMAAHEAAIKMTAFSAASVTEAMTRPVVRVYVPEYRRQNAVGLGYREWRERATHVVIRPVGSEDQASQPGALGPFTEDELNPSLLPYMREGTLAEFPLSALKEGNELCLVILEANSGKTKTKRVTISTEILRAAGILESAGR